MMNSAPVSVLDYGAVGDGTTDDTAAFNLAIATGRKVIVPYMPLGYAVNDIAVVTNMVVEGEKSGVSNGPTLIVTTNNSGAFTVTTQAFQFEISNFTITAATGVTGARAYKQLDKSYYTAYARFTGIETSSKLAISYDLFPIFTVWRDCRDAYIDAALAQGHQAINAIPATWNQGNQCNINRVTNSSFWGANGGGMYGTSLFNASLDIGYGETWLFDNTDFEGLDIPAIRLRGVYNARIVSCRFEGISATSNCVADITPSNPIGADVTFENCVGALAASTGQFVGVGAASSAALSNCLFTQVPIGVVLSGAPTAIRGAFNIGVVGAGSTTFLTGVNTTTYSSGKMLINTYTDGGVGTVQVHGVTKSDGNYTGQYNISVTVTPATIATAVCTGGLCFLNGYNASGGLQGWWLVAWNNADVATVIASSNLTTLTVAFTVLGGSQLQMNTTGGTVIVNSVALL